MKHKRHGWHVIRDIKETYQSRMTYIRSRLRFARMQDVSSFVNSKKLATKP